MNIERAKRSDINDIERLLYEVHAVHAEGRPDLFKAGKKKYSHEDIARIMESESTPIYVYRESGKVLGYAFVIYMRPAGDSLVDIKTMYIDDICVDSNVRGKGIGSIIMRDLEEIARGEHCYNMLLNVYNFNKGAYAFYKRCGMHELRTYMEKVLD